MRPLCLPYPRWNLDDALISGDDDRNFALFLFPYLHHLRSPHLFTDDEVRDCLPCRLKCLAITIVATTRRRVAAHFRRLVQKRLDYWFWLLLRTFSLAGLILFFMQHHHRESHTTPLSGKTTSHPSFSSFQQLIGLFERFLFFVLS